MAFELEDLRKSPNALSPDYSRFRVGERLLLTGHSHQAWPDCGFDAQQQAWLDAAEHVDDKWNAAFAKSERVRAGFARLLGDPHGHYALASSTHDLVVRFLSALPLRERPRLVTTDGEYHTIRRQLDRLAEERVEIVKVAAHPAVTVAERLADAVDSRTAAVLVSSVLYQTAHIVAGLGDLFDVCRRDGAELLVDAYHAVNVVPFSLEAERLEDAFVVGGGYKYCQLGEGNCFLRIPRDCSMRPVITGWFSEFSALAESHALPGSTPLAEPSALPGSTPLAEPSTPSRTVYGVGADRFAGSTYDPTSHYRAAAVFDFFESHELTPEFLRRVSQHQVRMLAENFDALGIDASIVTRDRSVALDHIGGFLALRSPHAPALCASLRERGVMADHRAGFLRLGPAPYLSDSQLDAAIEALGRAGNLL